MFISIQNTALVSHNKRNMPYSIVIIRADNIAAALEANGRRRLLFLRL